jgi:hypothetical protein
MPTVFRGTKQGEYSSPRTVLGFYAGVLAILEAGVVGASAVLASQDSLHYLVPWVLAFGGVVLVGLIGVVIAINVRDPTKLQLGQISGREFIDYHRMTLGDSAGGEYIEEVPLLRPNPRVAQTPAVELPPASDQEEVS